MKTTKIFFLSFLIFFTASVVHSQDTIVKKNGDLIRAKVTEIGTEEVKFKIFGEAESPVVVLKRSEIKTLRVAGQTIIDVKGEASTISEDIIVKRSGDMLKVKVIDIGTDEVKFKLANDPDGPTISIKKSEIKTMKVEGQTVIDIKTGLGPDLITKKDGSILKAKVSEVGTDEVKFKLYNETEGPTMTLAKSEIKTVTIDGQIVYEYKEDPYSISNRAILDKTSVLKFHFFSPLSHHLAFTYEWMNKPGFNWEAGFGIYGIGTSAIDKQERRMPRGIFLRFGPKFFLGSSSDIEIEGAKYAHPLKGRYFKPEIILSALSTTYTIDTGGYYYGYGTYSGKGTTTFTNKYQSLVINLVYGRQFIFGNTITLGYYLGVGYGFESKTTIGTKPTYYWQRYDDYDPRRYCYWYLGKNFPMTITAGITIGYIFRTPEWLQNKKAKIPSRAPSRHSMGQEPK
ncbi:MAG: hypothetical protein HY063_09960 [Bacteroidetes bacterium]|nr:hypothetical protein [Bacteroidota bacterium]